MKDKTKHRVIREVTPSINTKMNGERELEKILYKALPRHQSLIKAL